MKKILYSILLFIIISCSNDQKKELVIQTLETQNRNLFLKIYQTKYKLNGQKRMSYEKKNNKDSLFIELGLRTFKTYEQLIDDIESGSITPSEIKKITDSVSLKLESVFFNRIGEKTKTFDFERNLKEPFRLLKKLDEFESQIYMQHISTVYNNVMI